MKSLWEFTSSSDQRSESWFPHQ